MIIGEAPGESEIKQGIPFIGQAGQLLTECLTNVGLKREEFYITNILKWRPPFNRDPFPFEIDQAMPELIAEILAVNPAMIVAAGRFATAVFVKGKYEVKMGDYNIGKNGNHPFFWNSRLVLPIYHPAYGLRSGTGRQAFVRDMWELAQYLTGRKLYAPDIDEDEFNQWRRRALQMP